MCDPNNNLCCTSNCHYETPEYVCGKSTFTTIVSWCALQSMQPGLQSQSHIAVACWDAQHACQRPARGGSCCSNVP